MAKKSPRAATDITAITHDDATRKNIPTAELQSVMRQEVQAPVRVAYQKRNPDLDPQLVWRGKYDGDDALSIMAPPLYIQEKVHPKALVEDLLREAAAAKAAEVTQAPQQLSLFGDFNGIADGADKTDFYQHDQNWTNRMILGDSLQVMASLAEREGLRGQVQCIYLDPPYGIKFNSNFQWSTTSRDVKDGKIDNLTREPEQVKAFRDTWRDGIHSYLSYLRDRFIVARDLLTESGSIFVQIGDENVHRVRAVLDEVFGEGNFVSQISYKTTQSAGSTTLDTSCDYILWFAKNKDILKFRELIRVLERGDKGATRYTFAENTSTGEIRRISNSEILDEDTENSWIYYTDQGLTSRGDGSENTMRAITFQRKTYFPPAGHWRTTADLIEKRLIPARRVIKAGTTIRFKKCFHDFGCISLTNLWDDVGGGIQSRNDPKVYVVQTSTTIIQRCILMGTDPGDLVLDPTCGSGTTAYVAEQWGRRWITIDTSRVALALARARIMGARYPYYLMSDSPEGQQKESELTNTPPAKTATYNNIRLGFVYERVPHITLKSIANNAEIDVIYEKWQAKLEPLRAALNAACGTAWEEWEIPREVDTKWPTSAGIIHSQWWEGRIARQREIDASIAAKADYEFLYDKPYEDKKKTRVAGPFTVESLSPHRVLGINADDSLIDPLAEKAGQDSRDFVSMILDNLKTSGVQQAHKEDKITFTSLTPWPGSMLCAEGRYMEGETERRAGIFIGPEFGTVSRQDLVQASREAADADFDVLIACAFNYEAMASEFHKLGRINVLKARMNADLHMGTDLKNTGKGNLFVIFGEPDIEIIPVTDKSGKDTGQIQVKIHGVDVFYPNTGEIRSDSADGIACWFVDTDYNEESFFVRHAYFLGANDPYKALKTILKADIDKDVWETLHSDTSRPFDKPKGGRIAVKVINHLGDEVMKVFGV